VTRAEVKAEVLQARAEGTLIPAGEGEYAQTDQPVHTASFFKSLSQRFASHASN
jgi:hypothetical protein